MSARSYGSVRKLNTLGTLKLVKGLAQISNCPGALFQEHELPIVKDHLQPRYCQTQRSHEPPILFGSIPAEYKIYENGTSKVS
jgi:hypothetical protein